MIKTARELIESPQQRGRPHVVLLGAGANRAAFPNGDRASRRVPLMNDLVDIVGLKQEIEDTGESFENDQNFESIYSRLDSGSEPKHERLGGETPNDWFHGAIWIWLPFSLSDA